MKNTRYERLCLMQFNKEKKYLTGKKGFIFDLDGTLVDSMHHWRSFDWSVQTVEDVDNIMRPLYRNEIVSKVDSVQNLEKFNQMGIKCCIATATRTAICQPCIERVGIMPLIEFIICNDDVKCNKTRPDIYFEAAKRMGLDPSGTIVFEDKHYTTTTAKSACFTVVAIHDIISSENSEAIKALADDYIYTYSELFEE